LLVCVKWQLIAARNRFPKSLANWTRPCSAVSPRHVDRRKCCQFSSTLASLSHAAPAFVCNSWPWYASNKNWSNWFVEDTSATAETCCYCVGVYTILLFDRRMCKFEEQLSATVDSILEILNSATNAKSSQWETSFLANVHVRELYAIARPSVCLSSETLVRLSQAVEIFGNISTAFGTLAIDWHAQKISWRSS